MTSDQEMRDLVIRLDETVKNGFSALNEKLDGMEKRQSGQEARVRDLEDRLAKMETRAHSGASIKEWCWRIFGPAIAAGVVFVASLYFKSTGG